MKQDVDVSACSSSAFCFPERWVSISKVSTIKILLAPAGEEATRFGTNVLDVKVQLAFMKP